jgi:hypothetical protein
MQSQKYIVKQKDYAGVYRNPYIKGGAAMKWGKWRTLSTHDTLADALAAATVTAGLSKRSVFFRGKKISNGENLLPVVD